MGKPEGKRPLGRPMRKWEDGIKMNLREIGCGSVNRIQLAQDRDRWRSLVNTIMNIRLLASRSLLEGKRKKKSFPIFQLILSSHPTPSN
jgi:hypothetical protein